MLVDIRAGVPSSSTVMGSASPTSNQFSRISVVLVPVSVSMAMAMAMTQWILVKTGTSTGNLW
jgi:hypothetical protein